MPTAEAIVATYHERKAAAGPRMARQLEVRDAVNGTVPIPLPELNEAEKPMVANLIELGLAQTAQRIASTLPNVLFPPIRPGIETSERRARDRREAILSWWSMNDMATKLRKRARYLLAYGMSPVILEPDPRRHIPKWEVCDPISSFPPPGGDVAPLDFVYRSTKTLHWLRDHHGDATRALYTGRDPKPDDTYEIIRYVDAEVDVVVALGKSRSEYDTGVYAPGGAPFVELERTDNPAGICLAVVPSRICLDEVRGAYDDLVGLYWNQARMMALEAIAVTRAIFPNEYLESRGGEMAQIVQDADGLRGEIGLISGGTLVSHPINPGVQTYPTIDRLERAMRLTGGIPAEYGGESASNIRTGRRGQAVLSAAVDFPIQEAQSIFEMSLREENYRAIAIERKVFGGGRRAFYYSWNGRQGRADYEPAETFETDEHSVQYSYPGADINQLVVGNGQRIGIGLMSKTRGMELDPAIDDPDREHDRILAESLEAAQLQGLQQGLASGAITPAQGARISELVLAANKTLYEAIITADEEARTLQASSGPPGTPEGPVPPGAPEAQPGLGAGPTAAPEAIGPAPGSLGNLSALLADLRPQGAPAGG